MKKTARTFNANGRTDKTKHFFVEPDLSVLLEKIESRCFISVVNPSQTGKTTLMAVLQEFLKDQYTIINFQFPIVSNKSHIFPMVRAEIQQQLRIQFNNDITITEDNMKDLFSIGNKQRYFQGKQALLIVDEVQGLALADDDQRTAFLASWCQCKDQQENQALQASICVTNYMGEYFIGSPFSNTDCVNPKYFNLEQVGQMFKDYDEEYNVITSDKIVESIYSQSGGSPGLTQILGSLYHNQRLLYEESIDNQMLEDEKENKKMEADDMCDVWEEFSTSKRILFAVQQNQNYKKMLSLLQSDHNLAKAVAYSVVAQSVITDPARVDQLFCYNILKADPKKGYCLANPFISRLFHVFYQAEPVTSYRFIKTEGEFDFLSLLYATIPVMNSIALSRGPRLPSKNGIPKPKEAVFVQEYKTALLHVIRDSTRIILLERTVKSKRDKNELSADIVLKIGDATVVLVFGSNLNLSDNDNSSTRSILHLVDQAAQHQSQGKMQTWLINWRGSTSTKKLTYEDSYKNAEKIRIVHINYNKYFTDYTVYSKSDRREIAVPLLAGISDSSNIIRRGDTGKRKRETDDEEPPRKKIKSGTSVTAELYGTGIRFCFECPGTIEGFKKRAERACSQALESMDITEPISAVWITDNDRIEMIDDDTALFDFYTDQLLYIGTKTMARDLMKSNIEKRRKK